MKKTLLGTIITQLLSFLLFFLLIITIIISSHSIPVLLTILLFCLILLLTGIAFGLRAVIKAKKVHYLFAGEVVVHVIMQCVPLINLADSVILYQHIKNIEKKSIYI